MVEVRNMVWRLEAQLQAVVEENGRQVLAAAEMRRSEEQLREEVGRLKLQVEVLEQDNQRLSEANERAKPDIGTALTEQTAKVKQDLTNLERELTRLTMKLGQTEEAVEWHVGALEQAVMGLAETKDRTSRVESDVASLRTMMADGSAKVEEAWREDVHTNSVPLWISPVFLVLQF
jgi:chromosome segregation ATPase